MSRRGIQFWVLARWIFSERHMIYDGGAATDMICRVIPFRPPLLGWGGAPALVHYWWCRGWWRVRPTTCQRWDCEPCRQSTADSWTGLLDAARLSSAAVRGFFRALMGCEGCRGLSPCSPGTARVGALSVRTALCRRLCCKFAAGLLRPRPSGGEAAAWVCPASPPGIVVYTVIYALHRSKYTCVNGVYAVWVCCP